ncbi:MAG: hypothetical protein MASP_00877 [Candidatus Methanolliviera sp. GoM_asphalt]|nr:MAG: hypothetical protein MASP_00877 [Candidatus Methanolliviera sp. GoM_asphalt]
MISFSALSHSFLSSSTNTIFAGFPISSSMDKPVISSIAGLQSVLIPSRSTIYKGSGIVANISEMYSLSSFNSPIFFDVASIISFIFSTVSRCSLEIELKSTLAVISPFDTSFNALFSTDILLSTTSAIKITPLYPNLSFN